MKRSPVSIVPLLTIRFLSFDSQRIKLTSKIHDEYDSVRTLPEVLIKQQKEAQKARQMKKTTIEEVQDEEGSSSAVKQLIDTIPEKKTTATYDIKEGEGSMTRILVLIVYLVNRDDKANMGIVALRSKDTVSEIFGDAPGGGGSLVRRARAKTIRPVWHAPWKLMRVISGHLGWVRAVTVEPGNKWFATGAGDRTIKVNLFQWSDRCIWLIIFNRFGILHQARSSYLLRVILAQFVVSLYLHDIHIYSHVVKTRWSNVGIWNKIRSFVNTMVICPVFIL